MKTKIFSTIIACSLICSFAGCSANTASDSETETYNFEEANKNYGDLVHDDDKSFSLPMEYDNRFVTNDMASSVADYFYSIQSQDIDLYKSVTIDEYQTYLMDAVYADEEYTDETFLQALYNGIKNQTGDNFDIKQIIITNFDSDEDTSGASDIIQLLSALDEEYEDKIQDSAKLTLTFSVESDDETYEKSNQSIYILNVDGKYKIVTG